MVQRAAGLVLSHFSRVRLCNPWTVACQAPLCMGFSRQEYWRGLPCRPPDLPESEMEPMSLMSPVLAGGFFPTRGHLGSPNLLQLKK